MLALPVRDGGGRFAFVIDGVVQRIPRVLRVARQLPFEARDGILQAVEFATEQIKLIPAQGDDAGTRSGLLDGRPNRSAVLHARSLVRRVVRT